MLKVQKITWFFSLIWEKNINFLTTKCQGTLLNSEENVRVEIVVDDIFTEQDMAVAHMK